MSNDKNQNYKIGDIRDSVGVAIGPGAQASVTQQSAVDAAEVIRLLDDLARSVDAYADSLENAADIRESLLAAREEAGRKTARWNRVRDLLKRVGPALAGIEALSQTVSNIWALVSHG